MKLAYTFELDCDAKRSSWLVKHQTTLIVVLPAFLCEATVQEIVAALERDPCVRICVNQFAVERRKGDRRSPYERLAKGRRRSDQL